MYKLCILLFIFSAYAKQAPILLSLKTENTTPFYPKLEVRHLSTEVLGIVIYRESEGIETIDTLSSSSMVFYDFSIQPSKKYTYSCATLTPSGVTDKSNVLSTTIHDFNYKYWLDDYSVTYTKGSNNRLTINNLPFSDMKMHIRRREYSSGTETSLSTIHMKQASRYQTSSKKLMYTTIMDISGCKLLDVYEYLYTPVYDTATFPTKSLTSFYTENYNYLEEIRDISHLKIVDKTEKVGEVPLYEKSVIREGSFFMIGTKLFVKEFPSGLTVLNTEDTENPVVENVLTSRFSKLTKYFSFEDTYFGFNMSFDWKDEDSKLLYCAKYVNGDFEIVDSVNIGNTYYLKKTIQINDSLAFESKGLGNVTYIPITFYRNKLNYHEFSSGTTLPYIGDGRAYSKEFFRPNSMLVKGVHFNQTTHSYTTNYKQVVFSPKFGTISATVPVGFLPNSDYSTYGSDLGGVQGEMLSVYPYVLSWHDTNIFPYMMLKFSALKIDSTRNLIYGFDRENHKLEILSFEVADTSSESIIDVDNYPKAGNSFSIRALKTASSISFSGLKENRKYSAEIFLLNGKRVVNTVLASEMNSLNIAHLAEGAFIIAVNELHTKKQAYIGRFTIGN